MCIYNLWATQTLPTAIIMIMAIVETDSVSGGLTDEHDIYAWLIGPWWNGRKNMHLDLNSDEFLFEHRVKN